MPRKQTFSAELATVRRALRGLPDVTEREHYGGPGFCVNGKMFALYWMKEGRWILKLPHDQQMMLFDARPQTFAPMRSGRMIWSYVNIGDLGANELVDLLARSRQTVAPKKRRTTMKPD